jgi:hypothetical protein
MLVSFLTCAKTAFRSCSNRETSFSFCHEWRKQRRLRKLFFWVPRASVWLTEQIRTLPCRCWRAREDKRTLSLLFDQTNHQQIKSHVFPPFHFFCCDKSFLYSARNNPNLALYCEAWFWASISSSSSLEESPPPPLLASRSFKASFSCFKS